MSAWIRRPPRSKLEELTTLWHLLGEPNTRIASERGQCGENLGGVVDRREDTADSGDRCPVCQGIYSTVGWAGHPPDEAPA